MTMSSAGSDTGADLATLDREFAVRWYQSWIDAWNSHDPDRVREIVTDDFVRYMLGAYPDLVWEVTAPPLFCDGIARAAFGWRGTGHFSGTLTPPGIPGTGKPFAF